jgi:hypothetical protein
MVTIRKRASHDAAATGSSAVVAARAIGLHGGNDRCRVGIFLPITQKDKV